MVAPYRKITVPARVAGQAARAAGLGRDIARTDVRARGCMAAHGRVLAARQEGGGSWRWQGDCGG